MIRPINGNSFFELPRINNNLPFSAEPTKDIEIADSIHNSIYADQNNDMASLTFSWSFPSLSDAVIHEMNLAELEEYGTNTIASKFSTETQATLEAINKGWSAGGRISSVGNEVAFSDNQGLEHFVLDKNGFMPEDGKAFLDSNKLGSFISEDGRLQIKMSEDGKSFTIHYDKDDEGTHDITATYQLMPKEYAKYASALGLEYELTEDSNCWVKTREEYDQYDPLITNENGVRAYNHDSGYTLTRDITENKYKTLFGKTVTQYEETFTALVNTDGGAHTTEDNKYITHDEICETAHTNPYKARTITMTRYNKANEDGDITGPKDVNVKFNQISDYSDFCAKLEDVIN